MFNRGKKPAEPRKKHDLSQVKLECYFVKSNTYTTQTEFFHSYIMNYES